MAPFAFTFAQVTGNLGIGTDTPAHDIDIESTNPTLILTQSGAVNQANSGRILFAEAPAYSSGHFEIKYDGASNRLRFNSPIDGTTNLMNIGRDGLIGIDAATPSYKLDIQNAGSSGINISGTGAFVRWNSGDMQIRNDGSYAMAFDTWTGSALTEKMLIDSAGNIIIAGQTVNHIKTDTSDGSDNKGMVINSAGGPGSSSRGAYISMYGNEHASTAGDMYITAGNTSGAELRLNAVHSGGVVTTYAGGNLRHTVSSTETSIANYLEVTNTIATENTMGTSGEWNAARIRVEATNTVDTTGFTGIRFATSTADNYGWSMGANRSGSGRGSLRIFEHSGAATGNERFTIKQDGNVGINETNPAVPLHISKDSASGENIALLLDNNNTTAGNEIGILFRSMVGSTNTDFEIFGKANAANNMDLVFQSDGSVERMRLKNDGDLQIARYLEHLGDTNSYLGWSAADDFRIYVGGRELVRLDEGTDPDIAKFMTDEFRMYSSGVFHADGDIIAFSTTTSSDKRLKKNIKPITNALDIVEKLQGVHFDWKKDDEKSLGYIAQDVEKVLPEMVKEHEHFGNGEYKTVNYAAMVSIMGEAIKELKAEVEELKKQIK
jgi:hypothetical protein